MDKYIYIKKENIDFINHINVNELKSDKFGIIDVLVKLGCEIMTKEHFKSVCNVGDFVLVGYDDHYTVLEVIKKDANSVYLSPNDIFPWMERVYEWASHLDANILKDCKRICSTRDIMDND